MRRAAVVGIAALALVAFVAPAHAGDKKLPKAISLVESIRGTVSQSHYVRTTQSKPTPAQSSMLRIAGAYSLNHYIREAPPAR